MERATPSTPTENGGADNLSLLLFGAAAAPGAADQDAAQHQAPQAASEQQAAPEAPAQEQEDLFDAILRGHTQQQAAASGAVPSEQAVPDADSVVCGQNKQSTASSSNTDERGTNRPKQRRRPRRLWTRP